MIMYHNLYCEYSICDPFMITTTMNTNAFWSKASLPEVQCGTSPYTRVWQSLKRSVKLWRGLNRRRCLWDETAAATSTATDLQPGDSIRWNLSAHLKLPHTSLQLKPGPLWRDHVPFQLLNNTIVCVIHLFCPSVFHLCVEIFICSSTCLSQALSIWRLAVKLDNQNMIKTVRSESSVSEGDYGGRESSTRCISENTCKVRKQLPQLYNTNAHNTTKKNTAAIKCIWLLLWAFAVCFFMDLCVSICTICCQTDENVSWFAGAFVFLKLQRIELSRPPLETHKEISLRQTRVRRWRGACGRSFLGPAVGSKAGSEHVPSESSACSSHPGREAADSGSERPPQTVLPPEPPHDWREEKCNETEIQNHL